MAKKCARTFSIVVEKGKKSILDVGHLLPDALPRSVRTLSRARGSLDLGWQRGFARTPWTLTATGRRARMINRSRRRTPCLTMTVD